MTMKKKKYLKKGVASIFLAYILLAVMLVFLFGICIPFMMAWYVQVYTAGQQILTDSNINAQISAIENETMRNTIQGVFTTSEESVATNIEILGFFFQYSWIIVIVVIVFMLFMRTRVLVETQTIV